jgi:hypothetical protein
VSQNPIVSLIVQGARARGLDPAAVLAVASQEGLSGRIGDGGHAYGPFQLNNAGGVLTGKFPNLTPQQRQAWASSPAGINYALDGIANVAKGLKGQQAVNAIVTRFERPANPGKEIAGANASYGNYAGGASQAILPSGPPQQPVQSLPGLRPNPRSNDLAILNEGAKLFGLPPLPSIPSAALPTQQPMAGPVAPPPVAPAQPQLKVKGPTLGYIEHQAAPFGLTVTSTTGGQHAEHSYHYQGRAADFGGPPQKMASLAKYALQHAANFTEFIYTGPGNPGYAILNGRVIPNSELPKSLYDEHTNHVHLAR